MKICMFTNTFHPHVGGVANSVGQFAYDLRQNGHQVMVVAPTFPGLDEQKDAENNVFRVPAVQNFNGSDFSVRIPIPFVIDSALNKFDPDIIHSHHPYLLGDSALRAAQQRNLPLCFTHHTRYEEYTHYVTTSSDLLKAFALNLSTEYANQCRQIVAPSRSIAKLIRDRGVLSPVAIIPTGVDIDFFGSGEGIKFRQRHKIPPETTVIGHVGRLAPEKNLEYLTEAVITYMKQRPESWFIIAGDGPSKSDIYEKIDRNGLSRRLVMTGSLKGQALADFYQAMDIFIFSSKSETQGMVLTEAMAAGKPVFALDAPGVRDVVKDGYNGCLLPAETPADLFAKVLLTQSHEKDRMSGWTTQALKTAKRFSREITAQKLSALYRTVLNPMHHPHQAAPSNTTAWNELLGRIKGEWRSAWEALPCPPVF